MPKQNRTLKKWVQLRGGQKNLNLQNFVWPETVAIDNLATKQPKIASFWGIFSCFQLTHQTIGPIFAGKQHCKTRWVKETSCRHSTLWTLWLDENAWQPVHVNIDKEVAEGGPALALLPNKSEEEEITNNCGTLGGNGNISVRRSNRTFKPPDRLGGVS